MKVKKRTAVIVIAAAVAMAAAPFLGIPWGWWPSFGGSYADSVKGIVWVKERCLRPKEKVKVGDNISYVWCGQPAMKRVWKVSPDEGWIWVGGDNHGDGASSGSCEVGWIKLPGSSSKCPSYPQPNPKTAPSQSLVARSVVVGLFAPFDWRSNFEKTTRFFNRPEDVVVGGKWLILKGEKVSTVYDRATGNLVREIPGLVTRCDGKTVSLLRSTGYAGDPQEGWIDLVTGKVQFAALPQIASPKVGQIDLRQAEISTTSKAKNPVNVLDGNPRTFWGVGRGSALCETLTVKFTQPTKVKSIDVDYSLMYGTTLTLVVHDRKGERIVQPGQVVDEVIDRFTITLRQNLVSQPVTGTVREVVLNG